MKTGVSYFGNRILKHVKEDLQKIVEHNYNFVVHTFGENDLKYYEGTMYDIIKASHELGLEVYIDPWGLGRVFGGEAFSNFLVENTDAWQVASDGVPVPMACLNNSKFKEFVKKWVSAAIDLGSDVIFWDEPHLYKEGKRWSCRCDICKQRFKEEFGYEMPSEFTEDVIEFRERTIADFLREMSSFAHQRGTKNAICLLAIEDPRYGGIKDWERICKIETIEIFGTDPYWISAQQKATSRDLGEEVSEFLRVENFVSYFSQKVYDLCQRYGKEGQIWIQAFKIPEGREQEVATAIDVTYDAGIRNIAAWGFDGCSCISSIRSARPDIVWRIIGESFKRVLRKEADERGDRFNS